MRFLDDHPILSIVVLTALVAIIFELVRFAFRKMEGEDHACACKGSTSPCPCLENAA